MSPIQVDCAACGATFRVAAEHAGKRARCKECSAPIAIPSPQPGDGSGAPGGAAADDADPAAGRPERATGGRSRRSAARGGGRRSPGGGRSRRRGVDDEVVDGLPVPALLAGVGAALAGAVAWGLLLKFGSVEINWLGIGIGAGIGFAIRTLDGRGAVAAVAAAALALASVAGGKYAGYSTIVPDVAGQFVDSAEGQSLIREQYLMAKKLGRLAREHGGEPTTEELRGMVEAAYPDDPPPTDEELADIRANLEAYRSLEGPGAFDEYRAYMRDDAYEIFDPTAVMLSDFGMIDLLFLGFAAAAAFGAVVRD